MSDQSEIHISDCAEIFEGFKDHSIAHSVLSNRFWMQKFITLKIIGPDI